MPHYSLQLPTEAIHAFCRKWQVREFSLFGSILRENFGPESDVDVLVDFLPGTHRDLYDLMDMEDELKEIFHREVDLVTRGGIERSANYLRRRTILSEAETVYG
jgi:uncharacterized protein